MAFFIAFSAENPQLWLLLPEFIPKTLQLPQRPLLLKNCYFLVCIRVFCFTKKGRESALCL